MIQGTGDRNGQSGEAPLGAPAGERVPLGRAELLLILAFWTCMALLTSLSQVMDPRARGGVPHMLPSAPIEISFVQAYLWAAITPVVFWLTHRFSLERANWGRRLVLFLCVGVLVAVAMDAVVNVLRMRAVHEELGAAAMAPLRPRRPRPGWLPPPGAWFGVTHLWFLDDLVVFMAVLAAGFARDYFVRYRKRQEESVRLAAEAAALKAQLAEARLASLRSQLDPHFLFNTLNAVSSLVERDPRGVRRMISRLSDLLRRSLDEAQSPEVALEQELDFVRRYLEIMEIRFQGRLEVVQQVAPDVTDALVPTLVLQPLVENAIKHGISKLTGAGRIEIGARREDGRVLLEVRDNGPGGDVANPEGLGLRNTRERLAAMYGSAQSLTLTPGAGGGTVARVELPYHTAQDLYTALAPERAS